MEKEIIYFNGVLYFANEKGQWKLKNGKWVKI